MKKIIRFCFALVAVTSGLVISARADEVTDWNEALFRAALLARDNPLATTRTAAIVQAAVFDTLNSFDRRYTPVHFHQPAPADASRRAAVVQAAYATLANLYPSEQGMLSARRTVSLASLASDRGRENEWSIAAGIEWGQKVADEILAWRSSDGLLRALPPFLGGSEPGMWRPVAPGFVPAVGQQFALMTPWAMSSPSQFRPAGPPALTSARYTADFNEVKVMGSASSAARTSDQTVYALFWNSTGSYYWNHIALSLIERNDESREYLSQQETSSRHQDKMLNTARLLAALNIAMADAGIACWDAKFAFSFWRPVTAISAAATDGNPATIAEPNWTPLLTTPPFQDYPSGHSCASGAAGTVLSEYFGEKTHFSVDSDGLPAVKRTFRSFSEALEEVNNARVFGGIHFRSACEDGQAVGAKVANHVLRHSLQPKVN